MGIRACACVCGHKECACSYIHPYRHMQKPEADASYLPQLLLWRWFLREGLSLSMNLTFCLGWLACQPPTPTQCWCCMDVGDLNSGLHTGIASTSPTQLSPSPLLLTFYKRNAQGPVRSSVNYLKMRDAARGLATDSQIIQEKSLFSVSCFLFGVYSCRLWGAPRRNGTLHQAPCASWFAEGRA